MESDKICIELNDDINRVVDRLRRTIGDNHDLIISFALALTDEVLNLPPSPRLVEALKNALARVGLYRREEGKDRWRLRGFRP